MAKETIDPLALIDDLVLPYHNRDAKLRNEFMFHFRLMLHTYLYMKDYRKIVKMSSWWLLATSRISAWRYLEPHNVDIAMLDLSLRLSDLDD